VGKVDRAIFVAELAQLAIVRGNGARVAAGDQGSLIGGDILLHKAPRLDERLALPGVDAS